MANEEKYIKFFNENVNEDIDDILMICDTANKRLYQEFRMGFNNPDTNKPDPKLLAACFAKIYEAILISLENLEKSYSNFEINICNRLLVGYSTTNDEDDEKQGNFMIYIRHIDSSKKHDEFDDPAASAIERCVQWNTENITNQTEIIKKISIEATHTLKDIDVTVGSSECIMSIFVIVYESIINYLKEKRRDDGLFEYEINMIGCFYIGVREGEDDIDDVYIRPNIESKLRLKNDTLASSKYE